MPAGIYKRIWGNHMPTVEERFWTKVNKTEGCWEWKGSKDSSGYGSFWTNGKAKGAHIFAYELVRGRVPVELELDHLCRNRVCVRSDHLEVVTSMENSHRGIAAQVNSARQWAKTHCPKKHPYDLFNTYYNGGQRFCRVCNRESARKRYQVLNDIAQASGK